MICKINLAKEIECERERKGKFAWSRGKIFRVEIRNVLVRSGQSVCLCDRQRIEATC